MKKYKFLTVLIMSLVLVCVSLQEFAAKPSSSYKDTFFLTTRFIMTKEEVDIYKHLPDEQARKDFVADFWKKRDPDPSTEENENFQEYQSRIDFANKWFRETPKGPGWDTERGRLLLQLGHPDRRAFGEAASTYRDALITSKRTPMEVWEYYRYSLVLVFADTDDSGRLRLDRIPSNLQTVIDLTKFSLDLRDQGKQRTAFKFGAVYTDGNLDISIPTKKVNFEEKEGKMTADFGIIVYVYLDNKKIDMIKKTESISMDKDEILALKDLQLRVPYQLQDKGKYYFDIVIEDKGSAALYRNFTHYRY